MSQPPTHAIISFGKAIRSFLSYSAHQAIATPLRFMLSLAYVLLFALHLWVLLHHLSLNHSCYGCVPQPPYVSLPFIGNPYGWSLARSLWSLALMCTLWIGVVGIEVRNLAISANRKKGEENLQAIQELVENDFVEHWQMFNEKTKVRADIPLSKKIFSFGPPEAMWVVNHFPQVAADPRIFWSTLFSAIRRAKTHTGTEIDEAQREMQKINPAIPIPE